MSFKYIQDSYKVPAHKGARIEYTETNGEVRRGTITGTTGAHLLVKLDGPKQKPMKLHPTWNIKYLKVFFVINDGGGWYHVADCRRNENPFYAKRYKTRASAKAAISLMRWKSAFVEEIDGDKFDDFVKIEFKPRTQKAPKPQDDLIPTDQEIVENANELARNFYAMMGNQVEKGCRFDKARHPEEKLCWEMACEAYDFIQGTDVTNALDELEETEEGARVSCVGEGSDAPQREGEEALFDVH